MSVKTPLTVPCTMTVAPITGAPKSSTTIPVILREMAESNVNLDDVVVIGYGSQKKESVVASINSIKPADIAVPTRSLSNSIAGRVAGVVAIQRSGEPGNDDASFWIRGQSSPVRYFSNISRSYVPTKSKNLPGFPASFHSASVNIFKKLYESINSGNLVGVIMEN